MKGYRKYFGKKIIWFIITFIAAVILNFVLPRLMPSDPVAAITGKLMSGTTDAAAVQQVYERYQEEFGTNKPMYQQFLYFVRTRFRATSAYLSASIPALSAILSAVLSVGR